MLTLPAPVLLDRPDPDDERLWSVLWIAVNGKYGRATLCTWHRARQASALAATGLPPHDAVLVERGNCRNCVGSASKAPRAFPSARVPA